MGVQNELPFFVLILLKMKIVILEPIGIIPEKVKQLKTDFKLLGHELVTFLSSPDNEAEIINRGQNAEVLILSNLSLSENVIKTCVSLRMISVAFAGVDHIPMELCKQRNIVVSNAAGYSNQAVAELTIGSAISLFRKIIWSDSQTRKSLSRNGFLGSEHSNFS